MRRRTLMKSNFQYDDIIKITTNSVWKADSNDGEPPIPTLAELQNFTQNAQDSDWVVIGMGRRYDVCSPDEYQQLVDDWKKNFILLAKLGKHLKSFVESDEGKILFSMSTLDPDLPLSVGIKLSKILVSIPASEREAWLEKTQARIKEKQAENEAKTQEKKKSQPKAGKGYATTEQPEHFQPIANHILRTAGEPTEERLQWLHKAWEKAREKVPSLPHPLAPIVRAWLAEQIPKIEPSRRQDTGYCITPSVIRSHHHASP